MKTLIALLCAGALVLAGCSSDDGDAAPATTAAPTSATSTGGQATGGDVHEITGDTTIQAGVGEAFTLSVAANGTTGYRWSQSEDGAAVRHVGGRDVAPAEAVPGRGGSQEFDYEAVEAGTATIELVEAQAGSGTVGQRYTVTVEVG